MDNIFILRSLHERSLANKKPLFVVYVDLKTAFDLTDRSILWAQLHKYGAEGRLIEILKELYLSPETALRVNRHFSDFYQLPLGMLQGDPISPLLFVIYISMLCTKDTDDPTLSGISIPELMLAMTSC
jgi:hypothetical protein